MEERIARVVEVFGEVGARWALVGGHAVGVLTEARATDDFDFVLEDRKLGAVMDRLREVFGPLDVTDIGAAVRVLNLDIDLIRSTAHPLFARALEETQPVQAWRIPPAEVVIALKFLSSLSAWRGIERRRQDVLDLIRVYTAAGERLDLARLLKLASEVYPGAERELASLLDRVDRGEPITI